MTQVLLSSIFAICLFILFIYKKILVNLIQQLIGINYLEYPFFPARVEGTETQIKELEQQAAENMKLTHDAKMKVSLIIV